MKYLIKKQKIFTFNIMLKIYNILIRNLATHKKIKLVITFLAIIKSINFCQPSVICKKKFFKFQIHHMLK